MAFQLLGFSLISGDPAVCESDPCTNKGCTDGLHKRHESPETAWGYLFLCPIFHGGVSGVRITFFFWFMAGASDSHCRMTSAQGLWFIWFLGCLPPPWPQHPTHCLSSCFVNLWGKFCFKPQVPCNGASTGASVDKFLLAAPPLLQTSQRMNFLLLNNFSELLFQYLVPDSQMPGTCLPALFGIASHPGLNGCLELQTRCRTFD